MNHKRVLASAALISMLSLTGDGVVRTTVSAQSCTYSVTPGSVSISAMNRAGNIGGRLT